MADLSNEQDLDRHLEMSKGGGGKFPAHKFEVGKNYFLLLSTRYEGGYHHWVKTGGEYAIPVPSANQEVGFSPADDAFDAWCEKQFKAARALDKEGDKDSAKKLTEKAKKVRSTYSSRFVALKGKVVLRENDKGEEQEVIVFKTKSFAAEPAILILSQARMNSLLNCIKSEWVESDSGPAKDYSKATDVLKFVICATQDAKTKKITWSLTQKVDEKRVPEIDKALLKEMLADNEEQYKTLGRDEFKKLFDDFIDNGTGDDGEEGDDLGEGEEETTTGKDGKAGKNGKAGTKGKPAATEDDDDDLD